MLCVSCNSLPFKQIKLGGGYDGYTGEIVFELDGDKTAEEKAPVFGEDKDGKKRLLFTFDEDQLKKLKDLIKEKIGIKKVVTANEAVSDYRYILERLK
jgi:hypothetical protein